MNMSKFKHVIPRANLQISELMNKISIAGENFSEIARQELTLYFTLSWPLFKEYIDTRRSEWEEYKDFTAEKVSAMALKNHNNLLTSGRWSNKDSKYAQILALLGVAQHLVEDSKKSSEKSITYNRKSTKKDPDYIRDPEHWILENPKVGLNPPTQRRKGILVVQETSIWKRAVGMTQERRSR